MTDTTADTMRQIIATTIDDNQQRHDQAIGTNPAVAHYTLAIDRVLQTIATASVDETDPADIVHHVDDMLDRWEHKRQTIINDYRNTRSRPAVLTDVLTCEHVTSTMAHLRTVLRRTANMPHTIDY